MHPITIIGSGLAGYTLAREIRKLDKEIPVRILTADAGAFYSKPMLSNALGKQQTAAQLVINTAEDMADKNNLLILTNCQVEKIDIANHSLITPQQTYPYSKLVMATGAHPIRLSIQGNAAADILSVNSLDDYAVFRQQLEGKSRIAILGAGLIGCEFANDLAAAGYHVDLIDLASQPLGRLLPAQAAKNLQQHLSMLDIDWHLGCSLQQMDKTDSGYVLQLDNGSQLESQLVLSAIGLRPDIQLAVEAGIDTRRGIVVDDFMQTSAVDIYALGDCAEKNNQVLPFVMPIMVAARALAQTLIGQPTPVHYPAMPVVVKTPAHPVVVCPPAPDTDGSWHEEIIGDGIRATYSKDGNLLGFALTGEAVQEKQSLTRKLQLT